MDRVTHKMANRGVGSTSDDKGEGKLEDMMRELALNEDDLDDVVFDEDDETAEEDLRSL